MKVGIQLYSVRNSFKEDPIGVMRKTAALGYKYWEICAFNPDSPYNYGLDLPLAEGKALIEELGVKIIGSHIDAEKLDDDKYLADFFDYQAAIGCLNPGLDSFFADDAKGIEANAKKLNKCGEMCKERGMRFHYHNHWHEFQKYDGKYVMDIILDTADPALVDWELDTFWAMRGGMDPVQLIHKYGKRICMLHQKDLAKDHRDNVSLFDGFHDPNVPIKGFEDFGYPERADDFIEVGTGLMDIQSIIDAANEEKIPYITLEQDATKLDELESIELSMKAFRKFKGIEWD